MAGGSWDPTSAKVRAGLYINFVEAALAQVTGGERGVVALPLFAYEGTVEPKGIYEVENEIQAAELFGANKIRPIKLIFQGKAQKVIVYTMPEYHVGTSAQDHIDMRAAFDAYPFNVFVFDGEVTAVEQDSTLTWMQQNKEEGKHFQVVFGGSAADDQNPAIGNARTTRLKDDYAVNLISGVKLNGVEYSSSEYAPFVAGMIAGTAINKSVTYADVPVDDVTKRLTNSQLKAAVAAGSFVFFHDGSRVRVERGIATDKSKIRKVRARIAMSTDLTKTANENYIGKIDNNIDGQKSLIAAIKAYLEMLEKNNVLTNDITVQLDGNYESKGDAVYIFIRVIEVDSMEEIYLTIQAG